MRVIIGFTVESESSWWLLTDRNSTILDGTFINFLVILLKALVKKLLFLNDLNLSKATD